MRTALGLCLPILALAGLAYAAVVGTSWPRPHPVIASDPTAWYSPDLFSPMPPPRPGDWMVEHPESPQSFQAYIVSQPVGPTAARHTIVLCPLGSMSAKDRERLETLRQFVELFYTMPVRLGKDVDLKGVTTRDRDFGGRTVRQYLTTDILRDTLPPIVPRDAICLLGVTMEDLYPEPSWNYVFGQATFANRVGVYSLIRFYPAFQGKADSPQTEQLGLVRSLKTLVHETGHMFNVAHCQAYACVMNGTNSLQETDRRPLDLCPECLKKFRWNIGFEVIARYEGLQKFYIDHGLATEVEWTAKRLAQCRGPVAGSGAPTAVSPTATAAPTGSKATGFDSRP